MAVHTSTAQRATITPETAHRAAVGGADASIALGVGLTNACDLHCAHCYRATGVDELSVEDVLAAVSSLPVGAVNFGTGESALHPGFGGLVEELTRRGIDVTLTTNGHSAETLSDDLLAKLRDIEFSIDHPSMEAHDQARSAGNWSLIERQMSRCARLGVRSTIIAVLMSTNYRALPLLAKIAGERGALLRINVYQAVRTDLFALSYDQFWEGFRGLLEVADLVTCGEPIVRAMLGIARTPGAGCGAQTVRVTPRGAVVPCVYGDDAGLSLADLRRLGRDVLAQPAFERLRTVPQACVACRHVDTCGGGCASRRTLRGALDQPDPYCPLARGRPPEHLPALSTQALATFAKSSSACTTIFRYRGTP